MAGLGEAGVVTVAGSLEFCGWDVAAGLEQVSVVETVDVFKGRDLNLLDGAPWPQLALAALVVEGTARSPGPAPLVPPLPLFWLPSA